MYRLEFLTTFLILLLGTVACARQYFISAPNSIRLGVDETVAVTLSGIPNPLTVTVYLEDYPGKKNTFSLKTVQVESEVTEIIHILVTPEAIPDLGFAEKNVRHYVQLVVKCEGWFDDSTLLLLSPQSGYAYIQLDKPIYTPKEDVKIRLIHLNENSLPSEEDSRLQILNPQGVIVDNFAISRKNSRKLFHTVIFKIPSYPQFGEWSVVVLYGHQFQLNSTVKFEVKEYVLPTFHIKLTAPDVILPTQEIIEGSVESNYVYGKPVNGTVVFRFGVKNEARDTVFIGRTQHKMLEGGHAEYVISADDFKGNVVWFPEVSGNHLVVEATVTDLATGNKEMSINEKGVFSTSPYIISFKRTVKDFKPGLMVAILADISFVNGRPASEIFAEISAVDDQNHPVRITNPISKTDDKGRVLFLFSTELQHNSFTLTIITKDNNYNNDQQAQSSHRLEKYSSTNNGYIALTRTEGTNPLRPGDQFVASLYTEPSGEMSKIFFVVLSKGKVVHANRLPEGRFKERKLQFIVTYEMVPSIRIVVYTLHRGELIVDSLKMEVEHHCHPYSEISIQPQYPEKEPGAEGKILITGSKNTIVGLLAVDEAVYALRNKDKLTRDLMFKTIETHDTGCGPGGGRNTEMVLANAGLVILTASSKNSVRTAYGCEERSRRRREIRDMISNEYTGRAKKCCRLGMMVDQFERSCEDRSQLVHKFLPDDDVDKCSDAFLRCCMLKSGQLPVVTADRMAAPRFAAVSSFALDSRWRLSDVGPDMLDFIDSADEDEREKEILERKDFRETWIFDDISIGPDLKHEYYASLPHSITTWVIQAVGLSTEYGMCIAAPQKVVSFKKIFVQLNLPYSVIRNEQVEIQATVFNYGLQRLPVTVYMYGVKDLCTGVQENEKSERKRIWVDPLSAQSVGFPVVPLKEGNYKIRVVSLSDAGSDIIVRDLRVVAEGVVKEDPVIIVLDPTNQQRRKKRDIISDKYTDSIDDSQNLQVTAIKLQLPQDFIPGTESCIISAIGDQFGPTVETAIQNPENLLQQPRGCGEQTMLYLAPTLYTLHYLKSSNQITPEIEKKAYGFIREGYKQELTFRKEDGSYSAWTHRPASTWLTAFVMKVFCQAKRFVHIDDNVICTGLKWLDQHQLEDGAMNENHPVIHQEMLGGIKGHIPMTAFVLITLSECSCAEADQQITKIRAMSYLENNLNGINDPYQLAVVAYALALSESDKSEEANEKLRHAAQYNDGNNQRHWGDGSSALSVETTGYALLTQLLHGDIDYSTSIVNWLSMQRKSSGAFVSTQDTVVALQALAEYAIHARSPPLNLNCNVTSSNDRHLSKSLAFKKNNAHVLQEFQVDKVGGTLFFTTSGQGTGLLSVKMRYNVPRAPDQVCKFDIRVDVNEETNNPEPPVIEQDIAINNFEEFPPDLIRSIGVNVPENSEPPVPKNLDRLSRLGEPLHLNPRSRLYEPDDLRLPQPVLKPAHLKNSRMAAFQPQADQPPKSDGKMEHSKLVLEVTFCVKYLSHKSSGMSIIDAGIFSGFVPFKDDLKKLVKDDSSLVDRFEISSRGVIFYLSSIPHVKHHCIKFRVKRDYIVANMQTSMVKVYDYYNPTDICTQFYSPGQNSPILRKVCEGHVCQCVEGGCPPKEPFSEITRILGPKSSYVPPDMKEKMLHIACDKHDYVWRGRIERRYKQNGFIFVDFIITEVLKEGIEANLEGQVRKLMARDVCTTIDFLIGDTYILMGKDGEKYETEDGEIWYRYLMDQTMSIYKWTSLKSAEHKGLYKLMRYLKTELVNKGCDQ